MGATISTAGKAMNQLEYHALNQTADKSAEIPTAEIVDTPEITADMIIDKKKPKAIGAKRAGIMARLSIHHMTWQSIARIRVATQWTYATLEYVALPQVYRGIDPRSGERGCRGQCPPS